MTPGVYNVSVGNESGSSPGLDVVSIQVTDSIPPEIKNIDILAPVQMPGGWINISAIITDNHHIDQVYLYMTLPNGSKKNYSLLENTTDNTTYYCNQTYIITGYFTFYIGVYDPSGNHINSSLYDFWFYETTQSKIINTGENTIDASHETGVLLRINATSNTTVTISRYPQNPYPDITQEMGLVPIFLELKIINTTVIEWPINLTFFFTSDDVTNSGMNTNQLLGIFYWNKTGQSWHKYSHTGVNLTEFNGYTGSSWALIDHLTTLVIGGDVVPPTFTITQGPMGQITDTDALFKWIGNDDYTPSSLVEYQYQLEGHEISWSPWTTATSKNYYDLPGGTYTFHLQARDKAGNIAIPITRSFTVPLNQPPVANFSWTPTQPTDMESVTFLDNSEDPDGSIINWTWDFGDETIAYGQNVDHLYTINGIYTVTLQVKDNDEDTNVIQKTIEIFNVAPNALFNYSLEDRTVSFTDQSTDTDGTITSWYWEFDDNHYSVTPNPTHTYENEGKYTVILTVTDDDMDSDIYTTIITIEDEGGIPGFELLTLLGALIIIFFYKRK
jgi:PKD repeat protein